MHKEDKMIITRTPTRIPIAGGGTDLPSYYSKHGSFFISLGINKYIYVTLNRIFQDHIQIAYSKVETVNNISDIEHPLIREALRLSNLRNNLEITSMAEVPSRAGLGSSGSFLVGLLNAIHTFKKHFIMTTIRKDLAEEAFHIEAEILKEPVGKQDQYIAAYGGLTAFTIHTDGQVKIEPLTLSKNFSKELNDNLLLFYTGIQRRASEILKTQNEANEKVIESLHRIKGMAYKIRDNFKSGDIDSYGEVLKEHWILKKTLSNSITNSILDKWHDAGIKAGAIGGKIVGAGGGGFLLFYCNKNHDKVREAMKKEGLKELKFNFDFEGTKVMANG